MGNEKKLSVVIAEDEYLISLEVAECARQAGYEVAGVAPDGGRALELIRALSPQAAILDIKMPTMDGLEAARRIRDEFPIPVIIMTAYESPEFLNAAKEAGVSAYLIKPSNAASIQRAVELAVARHEDLMELRRVNAELKEALARVRTLEGILCICAYCKKIRSGQNAWQRLEKYILDHTDAQFSHGVCPTCFEKVMQEENCR